MLTRTSFPQRPYPSKSMNSLSPSPLDIQGHLYRSFLDGKTADVSLKISGSWNAIYHLHRVVLIQSGFFRTLFTRGWSEDLSQPSNRRSHVQVISMSLEDPNITRAAFEVCISRLYGGGPPFHIPSSLTPTHSHPLGPTFPVSPLSRNLNIPAGHHLATPRFLLSLLATSVYLSIPSLASQSLASILNTVGPFTVIQYLNFAIGKQIGPLDSTLGEPEAAVGLEHVAELLPDDHTDTVSIESAKDVDSLDSEGLESSDSEYHFAGETTSPTRCYYGAISDKIGEAVTCWLARWGVDMFSYEGLGKSLPIMSRRRPAASQMKPGTLPLDFPVIWGQSGLGAEWVRAVISSDSFFVEGERDRYEFAKIVVEFRRSQSILESEEKQWDMLFDSGIYYANMSMNDLIAISQDVSATTGRVFVQLSTLQAAQWNQSVLRHHITYRPSKSPSPPSSPAPRDKELGVTKTSTELDSFLKSLDGSCLSWEQCKRHFRVGGDSSVRIGENNNSSGETNTSMDDLFSPSQSPSKKVSESDNPTPRTPTSEEKFFGLLPHDYSATECVGIADARWSPYPPLRFSIEFWDLDSLKEKQRLHSKTVWYAGSMFNIYVQIMRKKGQTQLGIYLHRQSTVDPVPPSSSPNLLMAIEPRDQASALTYQLHARVPSLPDSSVFVNPSTSAPIPRPHTAGSLPSSVISGSPSSPSSFTPAMSNTLPSTIPGVSPEQPYRDSRANISAYFMVYCSSSTGNSQTRFSSSPDVFKVSQSWGWKSSSLRDDSEPRPKTIDPPCREVSLRATVVLGLV